MSGCPLALGLLPKIGGFDLVAKPALAWNVCHATALHRARSPRDRTAVNTHAQYTLPPIKNFLFTGVTARTRYEAVIPGNRL